ncbi:MAG: hypothetical protein FH753_10920 [Firmicutes bacterium]|nr:hypothetical protein [Bacillota bacterium]
MKRDKKVKLITILLFLSIVLNIYLYNNYKKENNVHYMVDKVVSSIYKNDISDMEDLILEDYDREHWKRIIEKFNKKHVDDNADGRYSFGTFITLKLHNETYIINIYPDINGNLYIDDISPIKESERKDIFIK